MVVESALIEQFINIVRDAEPIRKNNFITTGDYLLIEQVLRSAGFEFQTIKLGALTDRRHNSEEELENYVVNTLSPVHVIGQNGGPHLRATGWLDCLFRYVTHECPKGAENKQLNIQKVTAHVLDSKPLEPFKLTKDGDVFIEYPSQLNDMGYQYFVRHARDGDDLSLNVGVHKFCGSYFKRHSATATHDALTCFGCSLRVLFPREVKTYGGLRAAFAHLI